MLEGREDISFGFNPAPFQNGLEKVNRSIAETNKNTENLAKKVSQGMMSAVAKIGMLAGGFLGVKAILARIPEVGMVFKQAGDIFFKNLLWPLRKELMPLLQGILNWVRDNRGMFVIWGQTIANIFRVIMTVGKEIFKVASALGKTFLGFINNIFGSQIKSFGELLNILTFKFALVAQFIGGILTKILENPFFQDIIKFLGNLVGLIVGIGTDVLSPLIEGITKSGLKDASTPLKSITDAIESLLRTIKSFTGMPEVKGFVELVGKIFGSAVQLVLLNVASAIEAVVDSIQWLIFGIKSLIDIANKMPLEKIGEMAGELATAQGKRWEKIGTGYQKLGETTVEGFKESFGAGKKVTAHDALITKRGDIIQFDPEDSIYASKGNMGKTVTVNFGNINLNVTEGNAKNAGSNFIEGVYEQIRSKLNLEFVGEGS